MCGLCLVQLFSSHSGAFALCGHGYPLVETLRITFLDILITTVAHSRACETHLMGEMKELG